MDFSDPTGCPMPCSSSAAQPGLPPAPIRKRRFSSAKIQPTRVKKVMQSDEEIGRMVASVPVAIGRAMEHFAEKLLEASAMCVQCSTSRTLSPSHMKQAMLQYRHFAFLEPLMREIPLPGRASEMLWHPEMGQQMPMSVLMPAAPVPDGFIAGGMQMAPVQMQMHMQVPVPPYPSAVTVAAPVCSSIVGMKRRQSNGSSTETPPDGKPKRGRPRKIRKEEKCVDDDGVLADAKEILSGSSTMKEEASSVNGLKKLTDRELMPPPSMLPLRAQLALKAGGINSPIRKGGGREEGLKSLAEEGSLDSCIGEGGTLQVPAVRSADVMTSLPPSPAPLSSQNVLPSAGDQPS